MYDCIVIGAGHNGLICSNYLAQKGWKVLVIEKRHLVGGACVTEEIAPGYKASIASYVVSLLLPEIVEELELAKYGYKILPRNPSSFTPFEDGRYLFLGPDKESNHKEIRKFSEKDADAFEAYEAFLGSFRDVLQPLLDGPPPKASPVRAAWRQRRLKRKEKEDRDCRGTAHPPAPSHPRTHPTSSPTHPQRTFREALDTASQLAGFGTSLLRNKKNAVGACSQPRCAAP